MRNVAPEPPVMSDPANSDLATAPALLAALDSDSALRRRLRYYAAPTLLVIDSNRHADLLFELISRRYEHKSTLITTNRPFAEWREVFPNAACVVSMVDRHNAEILVLEGESYRLKEAKERAEHRARQRRQKPTTADQP
jgi:DNA replication protein DnaC